MKFLPVFCYSVFVAAEEDTVNLLQNPRTSIHSKPMQLLSWLDKLATSPEPTLEKLADLHGATRRSLLQEVSRTDASELTRKIESMPESQRMSLALAMRSTSLATVAQESPGNWVSALQAGAIEASVNGKSEDSVEGAVTKKNRPKRQREQLGGGVAGCVCDEGKCFSDSDRATADQNDEWCNANCLFDGEFNGHPACTEGKKPAKETCTMLVDTSAVPVDSEGRLTIGDTTTEASEWPTTTSAADCEVSCASSDACAVWAWLGSSGTWANRCVELTAKQRRELHSEFSRSWPRESGAVSGACQQTHVLVDPYPGYGGDLDVKGGVGASYTGDVAQIWWSLSGLEAEKCETPPEGVDNACGIHIHEGKTCDTAGEVGGHYYDKSKAKDPWSKVTYKVKETGVATIRRKMVKIGEGLDVAGRAIVVHDSTGARVACAVLPEACEALSNTAGRCGPDIGRCNLQFSSAAVYCNIENGWCGNSEAHRKAQNSTLWDANPEGDEACLATGAVMPAATPTTRPVIVPGSSGTHCCWTAVTASTCGDYPAGITGGLCSHDFLTACTGGSECEATVEQTQSSSSCCWTDVTASTCGNYPAETTGGLCSHDFSAKCTGDGDCNR